MDSVIGFAPNWYEGQLNAGLGVYISPGTINGKIAQGEVIYVPTNSTTYIWVTSGGNIGQGSSVPAHVFQIAKIVSGIVTTGTSVNIYNPTLTQNPGILSITDIRNLGAFTF
jgi:hypothetical protein